MVKNAETITDKWEYKIIQLPRIAPVLAEDKKNARHSRFGEWEKELDELGGRCWEVVSVFDWVEDYPTCLLKRNKKYSHIDYLLKNKR